MPGLAGRPFLPAPWAICGARLGEDVRARFGEAVRPKGHVHPRPERRRAVRVRRGGERGKRASRWQSMLPAALGGHRARYSNGFHEVDEACPCQREPAGERASRWGGEIHRGIAAIHRAIGLGASQWRPNRLPLGTSGRLESGHRGCAPRCKSRRLHEPDFKRVHRAFRMC